MHDKGGSIMIDQDYFSKSLRVVRNAICKLDSTPENHVFVREVSKVLKERLEGVHSNRSEVKALEKVIKYKIY